MVLLDHPHDSTLKTFPVQFNHVQRRTKYQFVWIALEQLDQNWMKELRDSLIVVCTNYVLVFRGWSGRRCCERCFVYVGCKKSMLWEGDDMLFTGVIIVMRSCAQCHKSCVILPNLFMPDVHLQNYSIEVLENDKPGTTEVEILAHLHSFTGVLWGLLLAYMPLAPV